MRGLLTFWSPKNNTLCGGGGELTQKGSKYLWTVFDSEIEAIAERNVTITFKENLSKCSTH